MIIGSSNTFAGPYLNCCLIYVYSKNKLSIVHRTKEGTAMTLQVGNIVTFVPSGMQGEVIEILDDEFVEQDGAIYVLPCLGRREFDASRYPEEELRQDADWTPKNRANKLFTRSGWHSLSTLTEPINPTKECMHKDCVDGKRTTRIMVNIWGSVCEYDVCDVHATQYHGSRLDDFPSRG